ncbi:MAG: hypothetical protein A3G08_04640 [Candidatus Magasanikbacteria bacterium RIFCSPLOWO2_12_FULL_47_9b]|nr:MAG: hypothetical protein A3C10_00305 [Candidatus Magasanikbacteria bacterium RIFCSPHIGHO2_02_FULL_48_18]OGH83031.1 MAG: hypothetical protein A3G08_04640 [Candidatus Magasanikbacteria bacterium RIFCSPLOWO2_12_FULL_47_9b]
MKVNRTEEKTSYLRACALVEKQLYCACVSYFLCLRDMHISWLGGTAIKIQTKPFDTDITIIINPYKPVQGDFPRSLLSDIALFSARSHNTITLMGNPFLLETPGECEIKGVLVHGIEGKTPEEILFRIDSEHMSVAHLGSGKTPLGNQQIDALQGVDILILPVGGVDTYDAETATKIANMLEPRVIIPVAYRCDNDPKADPIETFLKEIGIPGEKTEKKVILKKKDLPQEETKIFVVSKE